MIVLAGSPMGDMQTFFWVVVEGLTGLVVVGVLVLIAGRELVRMWRSGDDRLLLFVCAGTVLAGFAFTAIATYGVTWGALHYHGP